MTRSPALLLGMTLSTLLLSSCGTEEPPPSTAAGPNVLWICIDTLRADHLSCYGYGRETSPNLDALARRGCRMEQALSQSPWTKPSIPSFFTSSYPSDHQVFDGSSKDHVGRILSDLLGEEQLTVAEAFQDAGYRTGAFVHNSHLRGFLGFAQGFDTYQDEGRPADELHEDCLEWLDAAPEAPFFAYVHSLDVHWPYRPGPEHLTLFEAPDTELDLSGSDSGRLRDQVNDGVVVPQPADLAAMVARYDSCIHHNDADIGALLRALAGRGRLENTVVVVTSDHGEEFYEHGELGHGQSLRDSLLRVPMILAGPGVAEGQLWSPMVEAIDLAPTLLGLCSIAVPPQFHGRNLAAELGASGRPLDHPHAFAEVLHGRRYERCVRTPEYKLIERFRLRSGAASGRGEGDGGENVPGDDRLRVGMRIEVQGDVEGGELAADEFTVEDGADDDVEVRGPVQDLDLERRRFRVGPLEVRYDPGVEFRSRSSGEDLPLDALREGVVVDVDGELDQKGRLIADAIERREDKSGDEIKLEACIDDLDAPDRELRMAGVKVVFEDEVELPGFSEQAAEDPRPTPPGEGLLDPQRYERTLILYDLTSDPQERRDLSTQDPERAEALARLLHEWYRTRSPAPRAERAELSEEQLEALRRIGYLR